MSTEVKVREKTALLDKMIFSGIQILQFENIENLIQKDIVEMSSSKVKYITASGVEFSKLLIEHDGVIDKMVAGSKIIGGKRVDYCNLETTIKPTETGNLNCYSVDDYIDRLREIQDHLENAYGIIADFSDITVKEVEINRTFRLEGNFENYHRVLNLIMTNLPSYLKNQMDYKKVVKGSSEYQTYYATSKTTNKSKRYLLFKIYNKTKAIEHIILLTDSYMRVEFRLVGAEKVKKALKTNKFFEMTDELINSYFDEQIDKLIKKPYEKWQKDRNKYLVKLMKNERTRDIRHWQTNVLRILQNEEISQKRPVLLDIEELIPLIDQLGLSSKRRSEVKSNFRKQSKKYETVFCKNDHLKLNEILEKLTAKDTAKTVKDTERNPTIDGMKKIA